MTKPIVNPNPREISLSNDELIISKTDPKGCITYANRTFMRIAGYSEAQLMGQPHNLIRHPDMPRGAYRLMWKTLAQGKEFFAIVKNLTAEGNFYWVLANVTPDYSSEGTLKGYFSVRRPPAKEAVTTIEAVYRQMRDIESKSGKVEAPDASAAWLLAEIARLGFESYEALILHLNREVLQSSLVLTRS